MLRRLIVIPVAFGMILAACGDDSDSDTSDTTTAATDEEAAEPVEIEETPVEAGDFLTLVEALQAADLVDTLANDGPFTVFAPTEDAFEAAGLALTPSGELPADAEQLTNVLTYHVVEGEYSVEDLFGLDGEELETVNGESVTISVDGNTIMVNDATVINADIDPFTLSEALAGNFEGAIHVIDAVLLPPTG